MATMMETQSHRPVTGRPRSKSAFSVTSDKSVGSAGKEKNRESHDEKRRLQFSNTTKANPNAAMNELQPIAQQQEKATIGSLRGGQFFDVHGNPIMDPDLSNPTRRRTERPLETILSFEAAIDREYKRQREANRQSFIQPDGATENNGLESRRSSSYWGGGDYPNNNGYYNQRGRGSYPENGQSPRNRVGPRQHSDSALSRFNNNAQAQGVYSHPSYGMTRDTVNTGGSNGSASDPWHNSTDPSSDNSSIERVKPEGYENGHAYPGVPGAAPQSREPISEEGHYTYGQVGYNPSYMSQPTTPGGYGQFSNGPPAVPPKGGAQAAPPRQVIRLDQSAAPTGERPSLGDQQKRKSWLKRTFSKNG